MIRRIFAALCASALLSTSAWAAPGLGEKVYGATVEPGLTEFETRYGRLVGGREAGEDLFALELAHGFSKRFYGALLAEVERERGGSRRLEALAVEGIVTLGQIKPLGIDVALYGEAEAGLHGPDKLETKLLLQRRRGPFDARLNLIAERALVKGEPLEFGYAASVDWEVADEVRIGAAAFGDLGTSRRLSTRNAHFAGPIVKTEVEHLGRGELGIEAGYLFAIGRARDEARGQARLLLEYEVRF
jgi:hypothetical protein